MLGAGIGAHTARRQLVQRGLAEWVHGLGSPCGSCACATHPGQPGCSPWLPSPHPHATRCCSTYCSTQGSLAPGGGGCCPPQRRAMGPPKPLSQQQAARDARSRGPSVLLWRMISGTERPKQPCQGPGGCLASPATHGQPGSGTGQQSRQLFLAMGTLFSLPGLCSPPL